MCFHRLAGKMKGFDIWGWFMGFLSNRARNTPLLNGVDTRVPVAYSEFRAPQTGVTIAVNGGDAIYAGMAIRWATTATTGSTVLLDGYLPPSFVGCGRGDTKNGLFALDFSAYKANTGSENSTLALNATVAVSGGATLGVVSQLLPLRITAASGIRNFRWNFTNVINALAAGTANGQFPGNRPFVVTIAPSATTNCDVVLMNPTFVFTMHPSVVDPTTNLPI